MLYTNWIRDLFRPIGYPIETPSKLYEYNQATIKILLADIITSQYIPIDVLITALLEIHLIKTFKIVVTRSNMQLSDLTSKPHGGNFHRNVNYFAIGSRFYHPPVSVHYQLLSLIQFHVSTHINCGKKKKSDIKKTKISNVRNLTPKSRADQI